MYRYDCSVITHVGDRVKVSVRNIDTGEDYNIDFTQEDLRKFFIVLSLYFQGGDFSFDESNCVFKEEKND